MPAVASSLAGAPGFLRAARSWKSRLAVAAAPGARWGLRVLPGAAARDWAWRKLIGPNFWWREFDFRVTTRAGVRMEGNTGDPILDYLYYFRIWEPNLTAWLLRRLAPGDTFVDVGANVGYFSLLASRRVGAAGRVVAIEAMPATFASLRHNLELNRSANVRAVNCAVSSCNEELQFFLPPGRDTGRVTAARAWAERRGFSAGMSVPARPLPAILAPGELEQARVIKIDVEGLEMEVLRNLLAALPRCRPELEIVAEVTPDARGEDHREILREFAAAGFHLYELENEYDPRAYSRRAAPVPPGRLRDVDFDEQRDLIFSRHDQEVL